MDERQRDIEIATETRPVRQSDGQGSSGTRFGGAQGGRGPQHGDGERRDRARPRRTGGRYTPRRKVCAFCVDHIEEIDYKDIARLRRHLSEQSKIEPRRKLGTCARHQRALTVAIKRARHVALLPFTAR